MSVTAAGISGRHLALGGTFNTRDVGGYQAAGGRSVRWRMLLRSDALHRLDDGSRACLAEIGLRTVIDLREEHERRRAPSRLGELAVTTRHRPLFDRRPDRVADAAARRGLGDTYRHLAEERGQVLVDAVRDLAEDDALPALVHCMVGKDRTGMVVALVLAALGVDDEVIAADFALTGELLTGAFRDEILARSIENGVRQEQLTAILSADPVLILGFLDRIREQHGSVEAFLACYGMTAGELAVLRDRLLCEDEAEETARA